MCDHELDYDRCVNDLYKRVPMSMVIELHVQCGLFNFVGLRLTDLKNVGCFIVVTLHVVEVVLDKKTGQSVSDNWE